MQDRKRLEEAIENDKQVSGMTDDIDTLFELAREGEAVGQADADLLQDAHRRRRRDEGGRP